MKIMGVVCEYNPFHKGHKYQLERARELGATHIAAVMSGTAVQRGDISVYSKYARANAAVKNGADLVLELPAPFSCSNAECFADSAVKILKEVGVDGIFFGGENDNLSELEKTAEVCESLKNSSELKKLLAMGKSYPAAVAETAGECSEILRGANNLLGVEYIRAVKRYDDNIEIIPIKRVGAEHNSMEKHILPSASFIRREILKNGGCQGWEESPAFIENADRLLLYNIITAQREQVMSLPDMGEKLCNRFFKAAGSFPKSTEEFLMGMKSKNITLARLRRMVMHLILGIKKEDVKSPAYARILAFNQRGREILAKKASDFPIDTSLAKLEKLSEYAKKVSWAEKNAVMLQNLCRKEFTGFESEYTRKIVLDSFR